MSKNITVTLYAPIHLDLEVDEMTEGCIMNAVCDDFRNKESTNEWEASYDALKSAVYNGELKIINDDYATIN